jgi:hypothetical protein
MCQGCWENDGAPRIATDQTRFAALFIQECEFSPRLHIIVEDDNYEDHNLEFCRNEPGLTATETACLDILEAMTHEERVSASAIANGYIPAYPSSAWPREAADKQ